MTDTLGRSWWTFAVRGLLALGFGVATWTWPRLTLGILILFFAAYALQDGVFAIVAAVGAARRKERWWPLVIEGVVGIVASVIAIAAPAVVARALFLVLAGWALVTGILELVAAVRLRREIAGEWLLALSGILRLAFGVLLLTRRTAGPIWLLFLLGAYALAYGVVLVALSIRLKWHHSEIHPGELTPQPS
jgi:uncharacterized membrane protein HdeD (DUF308 family)